MRAGSTTAELRDRLRATFAWLGDRTDDHRYADVTGWWRDPELLQGMGSALAALFGDAEPTAVIGLEARGFLLGPLVARELAVGFVEIRKDPEAASDSDRWLRRTTPPDYRDRQLTLGVRRDLLNAGDRVVLVDDWIDTGGQALGARRIIDEVNATWLGAAVVVDALDNNTVRRDLGVRSLMHIRELG
jgi:adenine phosphoribosyltransferase